MSKYIFAGREFKSKKAVVIEVRAVIESYREGNVLDEADFKFMMDLLSLHPRVSDKIGCGVQYIKRAVSPFWKSACFRLIRYDGSTTDFSWRECLYPSTHEDDVKVACRIAVQGQIEAAREKALNSVDLFCPITGEKLTKENLHIDHEPPMTFAAICAKWKAQPQMKRRKMKVIGHCDNSDIVRFEDTGLARDFAEFHQNFARLRPLSVDGNYTVERLFKRGIII